MKNSSHSEICEINFKPTLARFVGVVFFLVGVSISIKQYIPYSLYCVDKKPGIARQCTIYQSGLTWIMPGKTFNEVYKAKVLRMSGGKSFRARLYTEKQKYTVSSFSINNRNVIKNAVDSINAYIKKSSTNLFVIPKITTWQSQIIFWFFIPFSIYFLSLLQTRRLVINKKQQTVTISNLSGRKIEELEKISLQEVDKFELQTSNGRIGISYSIVIKLKNGQIIEIESASTNYSYQRLKIIKRLNSFIK